MSDRRIGIVHPGAMGAAVGAALVAAGREVHWASMGRSEATSRRAAQAGLHDCGDLAGLCDTVDVLLSICPPHAARAMATAVADAGFHGIYVDANAVAPSTTIAIAEHMRRAGATPLDGSIIGPPPQSAGTTRFYLSGEQAAPVRLALGEGCLEVIVVDGAIGAASALKVAHATWRKGTTALLATIRGFARHHGVDDTLLEEWAISLPDLVEHSERQPRRDAAHAWRFAGELEEAAAAFRDVGLPDGAASGAARTYAALAGFKDVAEPPELDALLDALDAAATPAGGPDG